MNQLKNIFYDNVCNSVFDTHGKIYEIKEHRNWKYININNIKVGINKLPIKMKIFSFDDFKFNYIFGGLFKTHPCIAMEYYIYRKISNKYITFEDYYKKFKL